MERERARMKVRATLWVRVNRMEWMRSRLDRSEAARHLRRLWRPLLLLSLTLMILAALGIANALVDTEGSEMYTAWQLERCEEKRDGYLLREPASALSNVPFISVGLYILMCVQFDSRMRMGAIGTKHVVGTVEGVGGLR